MAVVVETTLGDITIDLYTKERPRTCMNFLKLCKIKYYNYNLFHSVQHNFIAQTGDPTGSGHGGESIFGTLHGEHARYYAGEQMPKIKHSRAGLVSMVNCGDNMLGAQFFITLGSELSSLDTEHCVFGEVTEGDDVLLKLNETICDEAHRPYQDIRITHTVILEDPFDDPPNLRIPDRSPSPTAERLMNGRLAPDEAIDEMQGKSLEEIEEMVQEKEAAARATILEIVGDLPDADMAPPENVLFVCKLNPVTNDDDLEIIFSRFGKINSCEVIRDKVTGDSLQYAFIEFAEQKSCEEAYFKMDNVLIDDRRIHVDFSQSVAKVKWRGKGRGVDYLGGKPGEKVESERHRNDKFFDRQPKYNQPASRSPIGRVRDDKRGGSRDYRRDDPRRGDTRRRDENPRNRDRSRSRNRHERSSKQRHRSRDRDGSDSRTRDSDSKTRDREGSDSRHRDREGSDSRHRDREGSDSRHKDREGSDIRHKDRDGYSSMGKDRSGGSKDKSKTSNRDRSKDRSRRHSKERDEKDKHHKKLKESHSSKEKTNKEEFGFVDSTKQNHNDHKNTSDSEKRRRKNSSEPETRKRTISGDSEKRKRRNSSEPENRKNSLEPETRIRQNSSEPESRKRKNSLELETKTEKTSPEHGSKKRKDVPLLENNKIEKTQAPLVMSTKIGGLNGNKKNEIDTNNAVGSDVAREKSRSCNSKPEKVKENMRHKESEGKKRPNKHSSVSDSSSESSSEESSSSSSEPRRRKKAKRNKKVLVVKRKSRSGKHKKRKVETESESSSDSSDSSSSDSDSEPRRSKHKKRKTKLEVVKIIRRRTPHKKRKKRVETSSSESSSSDSDVPRKKKKSRKSSTSSYKVKDTPRKKKEKNKRKHPSDSESSSSDEAASKKRKTSKKPSKKKQTSDSEESTSE